MKEKNYGYDNTKITDADVVKRVKTAIKIDIEKRKAMQAPVAVYDHETGSVYAEYSDGTRILMGSKIKRGSYGERNEKAFGEKWI